MHSFLLPRKKNLKIRMTQNTRNAHSPLSLSLSPASGTHSRLVLFLPSTCKKAVIHIQYKNCSSTFSSSHYHYYYYCDYYYRFPQTFLPSLELLSQHGGVREIPASFPIVFSSLLSSSLLSPGKEGRKEGIQQAKDKKINKNKNTTKRKSVSPLQ
jgi:hypothetical protein